MSKFLLKQTRFKYFFKSQRKLNFLTKYESEKNDEHSLSRLMDFVLPFLLENSIKAIPRATTCFVSDTFDPI